MADGAPNAAQAVAQFLDRYDQRGEGRMWLRRQFREPRAIFRKHLFERRAGMAASMRPKAGSESNSRSGLFTPRFYQTCVTIQVESGAAAHEARRGPPWRCGASAARATAPSEADNRNARPSAGFDRTLKPGGCGCGAMPSRTCRRAAARA